jgi:hypothetical protein
MKNKKETDSGLLKSVNLNFVRKKKHKKKVAKTRK